MKIDFYICKHCGNLITKIADSGVPVVCCGEEMVKLEPKMTDEGNEKHLPVVETNGSDCTIKVGSVPHPMSDEHQIEWLYIVTNQRQQLVRFKSTDQPVYQFTLEPDEQVDNVYSYCNLHGLWSLK